MRSARQAEATRGAGAEPGFTLIEVLVALVIVTLGMAALMSSLSGAADGAAYMRDKTFAQWVALNQIALARLQAQAPGLGDTSGEVELANRRWTWKQTVGQTDAPGIFRIDVSVRPVDVPPPKGDKDSGWFATVSGIRGNDLTIGTVTVTYGDIKTACEQFGLSSTQTPYALPQGINCNAIGPSSAGGTVRPNPGNSGTPRRSGGTESDAVPPSDGASEQPQP